MLSTTRRDGRDASTLARPAADPDRFAFAFLACLASKSAYRHAKANANAAPCIACVDWLHASHRPGSTLLDADVIRRAAGHGTRFTLAFTLQCHFLHYNLARPTPLSIPTRPTFHSSTSLLPTFWKRNLHTQKCRTSSNREGWAKPGCNVKSVIVM